MAARDRFKPDPAPDHEEFMPVITIKVLEGELTWGQTAELVDQVTEVVVPFVGEAVRSNVWVLVQESNAEGVASASYTYEPLSIEKFVLKESN